MMKKLLGILILGLLWSGNAYACDDVDGATVTYTSDCRQIVVTGDGSNITIDGATIKGASGTNEKGIITTGGTNTTITINSDAAIGYDTAAGLERIGILNNEGGSITTITNNGRIETRQSSNFGYGYPINNLGTIGDIVNSGDIFSNSRASIYNWSPGTVSKIENTATGDIYAKREFAIGNGNTIGTITNAGMIRAGIGQTIKNSGSGDTITLIENTTSSATIKGKDETIYNENGGIITTIKNDGIIQAWGSDNAVAINTTGATIGTIENTGTIEAKNDGRGISILSNGAINTITNSGTISGINGDGVIYT
ncbi:MAG: hypothetical protein QGI18_08255, partial [Candidatus Marinimicrobia bacterium]|nr:hypothetical protein [Candidatus Neomarinimicrobiota bacterium]